MRNTILTSAQVVGCGLAACGLFLLTGVAWTMLIVGIVIAVLAVLGELRGR